MNIIPKIVILRGNSGSGKTTVARDLQKCFGRGTLLVSQDAIRREMLYVNDGPETQAMDLMIELIRYGKENCGTVILEGILYADWYKRLFEVVKDEFGNNIYAYYFDISFEETLIRHKTRSKAKDFGEAEMKGWWRSKDYIEIIPEHIISQDMAADSIVNMIIEQTNI